MTINGDAALRYARRGWPVFPTHNPVQRNGRGPLVCSCKDDGCTSPAKHPRPRNGLAAATTDVDRVYEWWQQTPHAGVAIRTGAESGLVVVDIDPRHFGDVTWRRLQLEHGTVRVGRTIGTGGGGIHYYFKHPGGRVPNTAGRLGPGVDTRGDGGYVLAPPSRHASGSRYTNGAHADVIPELPDWIQEATLPAERPVDPGPTRAPAAPNDAGAWARAALNGELDRLRNAPKGARNDTLNRVAFRLGQIVAAGALNEHDVTAALHDQGIASGLAEREVIRTIHSGLLAGERSPSGPSR